MSNAIRFLEAWAGNPAWIRGSKHAYADEVAGLDVSCIQKRALLAGDVAALSGLLDGRVELVCMVSTPDEQPPLRDPGEHDNDPDTTEEPDTDD